jgi:ElaA protein
MQVRFSCLPFEELKNQELYEILQLRSEVFVVEQHCPYQDCDDKDTSAWHLMGRNPDSGKLLVYTRLLPVGIAYPHYASIGRVVSSPSVRGQGLGKMLVQKSIAMTHFLFNHPPIKIGAQSYLTRFYEDFGFKSTGEEYLEDGIPHTKMVWSGSA